VAYSLTMDLLEAELIDALSAGSQVRPGSLPLRDRCLPDLAAVLSLHDRLCAGDALALTAIARSRAGLRRGESDYRSGIHVNLRVRPRPGSTGLLIPSSSAVRGLLSVGRRGTRRPWTSAH
jgi:hypothetical protein